MKLNQCHEKLHQHKSTISRDFKIGIISSDILPETGEYTARMIIESLLSVYNPTTDLKGAGLKIASNDSQGGSQESQALTLANPDQLHFLGRRDDLLNSLKPEHRGIHVHWDWEENKKV